MRQRKHFFYSPRLCFVSFRSFKTSKYSRYAIDFVSYGFIIRTNVDDAIAIYLNLSTLSWWCCYYRITISYGFCFVFFIFFLIRYSFSSRIDPVRKLHESHLMFQLFYSLFCVCAVNSFYVYRSILLSIIFIIDVWCVWYDRIYSIRKKKNQNNMQLFAFSWSFVSTSSKSTACKVDKLLVLYYLRAARLEELNKPFSCVIHFS